MKWNKISEVGYPEDGDRVLVWDSRRGEARILVCNYCDECWDDEEGDDIEFRWDVERVPAWCEIESYEE